MNQPGIRCPRWYEKLDYVKDDGTGIVGYRWFYHPLRRLYRAIYYGIMLKEPDE